MFHVLPETDQSAILSGNSKISTTNLKLTGLPAISKSSVTNSGPSQLQSPAPITPSTPSVPSSSLKKKSSEVADENKQETEDPASPAKDSKGVGRPKKPADPEKAAKVRF